MDREFLFIAMGVGIEELLNGDISPDDFDKYTEIASEFLNWINAPEEVKQQIIDGLDDRELPSLVFKNNLKAVLLLDEIEQIT